MKYGNLTLGQIEAIGNKLGGEEGIARFLRGELEVVEKQKIARLTFIATHQISATTTPMTCDRSFAKYTGSNFNDMFIGKVEEPQPETTIKQYKLEQGSTALEMVTDLGGEIKVKTTLTSIKSLIDKQAKGEAGVLLTNGWWNVFFVEDKNGVLRMVGVDWIGDGWSVDAYPLDDPYRWHAGPPGVLLQLTS